MRSPISGRISEVFEAEETGAQPVVEVVVVVGDVVGDGGDLRLAGSEAVQFEVVLLGVLAQRARHFLADARADQRAVMLGDAFERLPRQIQPVEIGVAVLEQRQNTDGLRVVLEAAVFLHRGVEPLLARVAERRMAEVVGERQRLGEVLVQLERARQAARELRDFQRMGEPRAVMVALVG